MLRRLVLTIGLLRAAVRAEAHGDKQPLAQPPDFDSRVLARVGEAVITGHDFHRAFDALGADQQTMVRRNPRKFLEQLVQREVLYQAALRAGLDHDADVVARLAELRRVVLSQELLRRQQAHAAGAVTAEAARRYYETHPEEFTSPERVSVSRILLATSEDADAIVARLRAGEDFGALAQSLSRDDASRDRGGRIPVVYRGQLSPALEAAAFALRYGELSPVITDSEGHHVLLGHGHVPAARMPFETVRIAIERKLSTAHVEQHLRAFVADLERDARVEVDDEAIRDLRAEPSTARRPPSDASTRTGGSHAIR